MMSPIKRTETIIDSNLSNDDVQDIALQDIAVQDIVSNNSNKTKFGKPRKTNIANIPVVQEVVSQKSKVERQRKIGEALYVEKILVVKKKTIKNNTI